MKVNKLRFMQAGLGVRKQAGYVVLTLVLLAAAVMVALTAAISSSRGSTTSTDAPRAIAGGVMQEAISLADAYAEVRSQGVAAASVVYNTFAGTSSTALANDVVANSLSSGGLTVAPTVPLAANDGTTSYWFYRGAQVKITNNGANIGSGGNTYAFFAGNISQTTCQAIDNAAWGSGTSTVTIPSVAQNLAAIKGNATASGVTNPVYHDIATAQITANLSATEPSPQQGCFKTSDATATYVAYVIVEAT